MISFNLSFVLIFNIWWMDLRVKQNQCSVLLFSFSLFDSKKRINLLKKVIMFGIKDIVLIWHIFQRWSCFIHAQNLMSQPFSLFKNNYRLLNTGMFSSKCMDLFKISLQQDWLARSCGIISSRQGEISRWDFKRDLG